MLTRLTLILALCLPVVARADVRVLEFDSKALAGNKTGDPARQKFAVYLPPEYEKGSARYPVIYLLHGIGDSHQAWTEQWKVPSMLDRLIGSRAIAPVIVVMPDARNRFGGGFYVNSPVAGRWQDYVAEEIVGLIDGSFRTIAAPASRAVVGHSMGGYGAIRLGMDRPDVFGVVFAMSPCCLDGVEDIGAGNAAAWNSALRFKNYEDVDAVMAAREFYPVAIMGLLISAFPDADTPLGTKFPFQRTRGELVPVEPLYSQWLETFPIRSIDEKRDNLLSLRGLAIDFGYSDQFSHIPVASEAFSRELTEERIPHLLEAYRGDHRQEVPARLEKIVFPWVTSRLDTQ